MVVWTRSEDRHDTALVLVVCLVGLAGKGAQVATPSMRREAERPITKYDQAEEPKTPNSQVGSGGFERYPLASPLSIQRGRACSCSEGSDGPAVAAQPALFVASAPFAASTTRRGLAGQTIRRVRGGLGGGRPKREAVGLPVLLLAANKYVGASGQVGK